MKRWALALLALLAALWLWGVAPAAAAPFQPPPLDRHVVDASGTLSAAQLQELHERLDELRRNTGYAVVALIVPSLDGRPIEDVAYDTFNTWKIGDEGKDNGVLLLLAPSEKRSRIETGKGVGGELTDLQSIEILRQHVTPAMKEGNLYRAVDEGTRAIQATLVQGETGATRPGAGPREQPAPWYTRWMMIGGLLLVGVMAIVSRRFRWILLALLQSFAFSRGGGGGGRGGFGGGGYSGGGGRSGGGGASDGY